MTPRPSVARLSWMALASALIVCFVVRKTPQSVFSDPAYQIDALQEFVDGHSRSLNETVKPLETDLSKDSRSWIVWWPPGTQIGLYPFVKAGLPIGKAIRVLAMLCLIIGSLGWVRWFRLFDLPPALLTALCLWIPWMRYANNGLFMFAAEALAFASAPWGLWGAAVLLRGEETRRWGRLALSAFAAVLGAYLGFRYVLKYSAGFLGVGVLLAAAREWGGLKASPQRKGLWLLAAAGCVIPPLVLNGLNAHFGTAANGVTATAGLHFRWENVVALLSNLSLSLADADSLLRYLFFHPSRPVFSSDSTLLWMGAPAGFVVLYWLFSKKEPSQFERLTGNVVIAVLACLFAVWTFSKMADYAARHAGTAGIMLLPFALQECLRRWPGARRAGRLLIIALAGLYIGAPALYGVAAVFGKVYRTPANYQYGPYFLYMPLLAERDLWDVRQTLLQDFDLRQDLWYLPDPISAITLPGRAIVRQSDFMTHQQLARERFTTRRSLRLFMLLPPNFETNGKGPIIRGTFPQAGTWTRIEIPKCRYVLWRTDLHADSADR